MTDCEQQLFNIAGPDRVIINSTKTGKYFIAAGGGGGGEKERGWLSVISQWGGEDPDL